MKRLALKLHELGYFIDTCGEIDQIVLPDKNLIDRTTIDNLSLAKYLKNQQHDKRLKAQDKIFVRK